MRCREIIEYLERWAPREAAWQKDNPGLQAGSSLTEAENIFLCLELTDDALDEAISKNCNFIFTHHPLIFQPLKSIDTNKDQISRLLYKIIKNDITVYSSHTNLDFSPYGVSFQLASRLELKEIEFLKPLEDTKVKLVIFVPEYAYSEVAEAVFAAGAGTIGNYTKCSFSSLGTGTFIGNLNSRPAVGEAMKFETVGECKLEVVLETWKLKQVLAAMRSVHPYEEPAYDIYPLRNASENFGYGAIGTLNSAMSIEEFLRHISGKLGTNAVRYSAGYSKEINKVAVCGGSGSDLLNAAITSGADAFVTADVRYHTFFDATGRILLIDAGHYETEVVVLQEVERRLNSFLNSKESNNKIYIYSNSTNPVNYFNNL